MLNVILALVGVKAFSVVVDQDMSVLFTVARALLPNNIVNMPTTRRDRTPPETVV